MHLGRAVVTAVASVLTVRQLGQILPNSFCQPECPQCKGSVTNPFDEATLCQANSSFLVNCGSCQTCIWTYAIENPGLPDMGALETGIANLLDLCLNTTANDEVVALQSQVSRISMLGDVLTSDYTSTTTYSEFTMTKTGSSGPWTLTGVANPSWTTVLSTASWASYYYSEKSAESSASAALESQNQTASASTITAAPVVPTATPLTSEGDQSLSTSWIVGPVLGSVLGVATVFIVIYFTRRKFLLDALAVAASKDIKEEDDMGDDSGESTETKSDVHPENFEMGELETHEVHELPAVEPVGSELNNSTDGTMKPEEWPLPITPLRALFAMAEIRDERAGNNGSPQHDTYYNV